MLQYLLSQFIMDSCLGTSIVLSGITSLSLSEDKLVTFQEHILQIYLEMVSIEEHFKPQAHSFNLTTDDQDLIIHERLYQT